MEQTNEIAERLKILLGMNLIEIKNPRERRIFMRIKREAIRETVKDLADNMNVTHLSTITGVDLGQEIELLYHFAYEGSVVITVGITIPKENPRLHTITDLIPGATLYERELHELLGVDFEGHPNLLPLVLPEGWPQSIYPLRKERKFEELRGIGGK
jgi:membrane-bound hydrogenase subunit beta